MNKSESEARAMSRTSARNWQKALTAVIVVALLAGVVAIQAQTGGGYDLSWHTIDGGGAILTAAGDFELSGTIGQPDVGTVAAGDYFLNGGFWSPISTTTQSVIFGDGFESGDVSVWSSSAGGE